MKFSSLLRSLFIVTGAILIIGVPLTLYRLRDVNIKEIVKHRIEKSLSGDTLQVHIGDLTYHPFHGLTATNVVLNSPKKNKPKIGTIKRLTFSLNIFGILPGHPFIKEIRLHNASVNIPLADDEHHFLPIRNANAKISPRPGRIEISDTNFTFENIQFSVKGKLLNLLMLLKASHTAEQKKAYHQKLYRLIEELKKIRYLKAKPKAKIFFEADFSTPEKIQLLKLTLHAAKLQYQSIFLEQLALYASYSKGIIEVQKLYVQPAHKEDLNAWLTADLTTSQGHLILNSSVNPLPFLTQFISSPKIQYLKNFHINTPPQITVDTEFSWKDGQLQYDGKSSAILRSFSYKNFPFSLLELKLAAKDKTIEIERLNLQDAKGKLTVSGNTDLNTAKGHFNVNSSINPTPILKELFPNAHLKYLQDLYIESSPQINLITDVSWANKKIQCTGTGSMALSSFSYSKQYFPKLDTKFSIKDGIVQIQQFSLKDSKGELSVSGSTNLNTSKGQLTVHSTINPFPILSKFITNPKFEILQNLQMKSPPQIDFNGEFSWKDKKLQYKGAGSASLHSFFYQKQFFPQVDLKFTTENNRSVIQDLRVQTLSGVLQAKVLLASNKFQIQVNSTASPKEFADFFDPKMREFFNQMVLMDTPHLTFNLSGPTPNFASLSGNGELTLGRTAVREAWIDFARTKFVINNHTLTCQNFSVGRNEGRGSGSVTYDFKQQSVRLSNITSTMVPEDVMQWIEPKIAKTISVYKFYTSPHVRIDGVIYLKNQNLNALSIYINSDTGLTYKLLNRTLNFGKTNADVHVEGPWVKVHIPSAKIFQGTVSLSTNVSINPKNPIFKVDLTCSHINFARLTKLYFNYNTSKGFLDGDFGFQARIGKEADMVGSGSVRIDGGTVLSVPFLGPISLFLNQIVPGAGNAPADHAFANFQVYDRKVHTNSLQIAGRGFTLLGYGNIEFLTGKMDMTTRINARGLSGLLFFPLSKLFEYESTGTIMEPHWHLKSLFKR